VFKNNMSDKSEPKITTCKPNENWTKVSFKPDLAKFNMNHLESDVVALMSKRVLDIAGCLGKGCKVELKSFQDYVGLYLNVANANREEPLPRSGLTSPGKSAVSFLSDRLMCPLAGYLYP
jgi:DNA topoisomerase-2